MIKEVIRLTSSGLIVTRLINAFSPRRNHNRLSLCSEWILNGNHVVLTYLGIRVSDISQILEEAKKRWLRPGEVCEIIRNYQRFHLRPDPPYKPSGKKPEVPFAALK